MAWHDGPKHRHHPDVDAYIADLNDRQRAIVTAVRAKWHSDPDVVEGIAWGVPCWFRHGPLGYASAAKNHVTLGFFRGIEIGNGLAGTGKSPVAKYVWKLGADAPEQFDAWVAKAMALDGEGE